MTRDEQENEAAKIAIRDNPRSLCLFLLQTGRCFEACPHEERGLGKNCNLICINPTPEGGSRNVKCTTCGLYDEVA